MKIAAAFPLLGLSYHDLGQENRRLKRANRKLKNTIQRLVEEKDGCAEFVLSNPAASPSRGLGRNRLLKIPGKPCSSRGWSACRTNRTCSRRMAKPNQNPIEEDPC